jgi:hypothetical protein
VLTSAGISYSSNYGSSWASYSLTTMQVIDCDVTGQFVAVGSLTTGIYVSTNYGVSFTLGTGTPAFSWNSVRMCNNGVCYALSSSSNLLLRSSGISTWLAVSGTFTASTIMTTSNDGVYIYVISATSNYYVSTNSGNSFSAVAFTGIGIVSVSCSSNGQYVIFARSSAGPLYSTNYGATNAISTISSGVTNLLNVATIGQYCVASAYGGGISSYSNNYGANWYSWQNNMSANVTDLCMSSGGEYIYSLIGSNLTVSNCLTYVAPSTITYPPTLLGINSIGYMISYPVSMVNSSLTYGAIYAFATSIIVPVGVWLVNYNINFSNANANSTGPFPYSLSTTSGTINASTATNIASFVNGVGLSSCNTTVIRASTYTTYYFTFTGGGIISTPTGNVNLYRIA